MLERNQVQPILPRFMPADRERDYISVADIKRFLWRHSAFIAGWAVAGAAIGLFYILTSDPIYTARTQIVIEPKIPQLLNQPSEINLSLDTSQVETQLSVLRSEKIASMVIDELNLENNPDFHALRGVSLGERFGRLLGLFGLGDSATADKSRRASVDGEPSASTQRQEAIRTFAEGLRVTRAGVSYAIDISFSAGDPGLAARIANATAQAFVREQLDTRSAAASEGLRWLEARIQEVRAQMNHATKVAQEFRAKHDFSIPSGDGQTGPTLEELEVTADTYRKMYESLLAAFTSSVNQQPYLIAQARVIGQAMEPLRSSHPRTALTLAFSVTASLLLGIGLAIVRQQADRTVYNSRQVHAELGIDVIAELPVVRYQQHGFGNLLEVKRQSRSAFTRTLRNAARIHLTGDSSHGAYTIGIASALPSIGTATVASNLAALAAASGRKTLLVDADPDQTVLTAKFSGKREGQEELDFTFLGSSSPQVGKLLAGEEDALSAYSDYNIIIVNLPALTSATAYADAASLMNTVAIVAEWGRTPIDMLSELAGELRALRIPAAGVILTRVRGLSSLKQGRSRRWWKR